MPDAWKDVAQLKSELAGCVAFDAAGVKVTNERELVDRKLDRLVDTAVFGPDAAVKDAARWTIRAAANALGALSASIQGLYDAVATGKAAGFTVPAHNIRGLVYDKARALFRVAKEFDESARHRLVNRPHRLILSFACAAYSGFRVAAPRGSATRGGLCV